jgi:hypothetical protein
LRTKIIHLEDTLKNQDKINAQNLENSRKESKNFAKEKIIWNEKSARFEADKNKWRNFFQQATKEMKSLKKENNKINKILVLQNSKQPEIEVIER